MLVVELGEASFSSQMPFRPGAGQGHPLLPCASRAQAKMPLFLNLRTMPGRHWPPKEDRESKDGLRATLPGPALLTPRQVPRGLCPPTDRDTESALPQGIRILESSLVPAPPPPLGQATPIREAWMRHTCYAQAPAGASPKSGFSIQDTWPLRLSFHPHSPPRPGWTLCLLWEAPHPAQRP